MKKVLTIAVSMLVGALLFYGFLVFQDMRFKVNNMWGFVAPIMAQQRQQQLQPQAQRQIPRPQEVEKPTEAK